jgi:hypothetical protein
MKKKKLPLWYFVELIIFKGLVKRVEIFHRTAEYEKRESRSFGFNNYKYDKTKEIVTFSVSGYMDEDFGYINGDIIRDFEKDLYTEIEIKLKESMVIVYKNLSASSPYNREQFYLRMTKEIDKLIEVSEADQLICAYPGISDTLYKLMNFVEEHKPASMEVVSSNKPTSMGNILSTERPRSFYYQAREQGVSISNTKLVNRTKSNITNLYDALIELKLIESSTRQGVFQKIFSGMPVTKPIKWIGFNNQLRLFIHTVESSLEFKEQSKGAKPEKWKTVSACFLNRKGGIFSVSSLGYVGTKGGNSEKIKKYSEICALGRLLE